MDILQINFHDSNLIRMEVQTSRIVLIIDLCNWKQTWYNDGDSEMVELKIIFYKVSNYIWDSDKLPQEVDYDTILDLEINKNKIKLVLTDSVTSVCEFDYFGYKICK